MTEIELAKALRKSNYTCEGVNCEECKKTNYIHQCLMSDVQIYCDDILGADDNYIEKLEKENEELKEQKQDLCESLDIMNNRERELLEQIEKMKHCVNCKHCTGYREDDFTSETDCGLTHLGFANLGTCCEDWELTD